MTSPLVTIVTPSYNQGHFIRQTIESVLSQDYPNIEYIIMDGGSTDSTAAVASEYSSRLTFISERDRGQSHAINKGFRMAKGQIVAWLNSDDVILPGAVSRAVACFERRPALGAVYGDGYLIDREGRITRAFPYTEAPNLWKLVHLSDYILQQTVYFRRAVFDEVGFIDEDLHFVMDWDILIRIAMRYELEYVPEPLGSLREYAEAKTFSGGPRRVREVAKVLREYTGLRFPPGLIVYGLDTYRNIWTQRIVDGTPKPLEGAGRLLATFTDKLCLYLIGRQVLYSQGLYKDGWAAKRLNWMLPASGHKHHLLHGFVPGNVSSQRLRLRCRGQVLASAELPPGEFELPFEVPDALTGHPVPLEIRCSRSFSFGPADPRRLSFQFRGVRSAASSGEDARRLTKTA